MKLVLASNNAKKLAELQALFTPLGIELVTQGSLGLPEAEEPFGTFVENALIKARHAARLSGLPALADDSGLSVDALGGAPGVRSARYALDAGGEKSDAANNERLLREMASIADRRARFVCALVAVRGAEDPEPLIAMGRWAGEILTAPSGAGGFGYDPLMHIPALGQTVASLGAEVKNRHSHRALAAAQLIGQLREVWRLG
ncbi:MULTISPECIES: RdgB/HAM1 family non-canonical purine NTP pyrophosphatase [unclassified Roseateles]|uniref:RdgB/HAM1 family non-canonical purine NTP pyrophosphatase n=1 Tax=unclassified Roseateles TaxID=2626991 RepID=UPI0006FA76AA|nr:MULTISPECIES: RdgB/HAM1 family non-canonical purine NTP pyrophosphatase [unclassified Roseateles]KQW50785.1 non-canonical purine NTP pyrophosphatase [Pelomonas sp. Root405]KRA70856.1 non-canonical purine NTP pyrophosphatase [Pelomonas sp. Root662]